MPGLEQFEPMLRQLFGDMDEDSKGTPNFSNFQTPQVRSEESCQRIVDRAELGMDIHGHDELFDASSGLHLEVTMEDGVEEFISPDDPEFRYRRKIETDAP